MSIKHLSFITSVALIMASCSGADVIKSNNELQIETPIQATSMEIRTKAVLVYADWCGSCKVLDPKIKAVQSMENGAELEYVTLDYTNKNLKDFFSQAKASDVGSAIEAYFPDGKIKTGQLLLVDVDDQKVIGTVTKSLEASEIMETIRDAIAAS